MSRLDEENKALREFIEGLLEDEAELNQKLIETTQELEKYKREDYKRRNKANEIN